jgi:hypothetical protein
LPTWLHPHPSPCPSFLTLCPPAAATPLPVAAQLNLDPQQVVQALPSHVMAVLLGYLSGVLRTGPEWAAELTDCTLTDTGPLDHAVRGASVMVTFLELTPRFRCLSAGTRTPTCLAGCLLTTMAAPCVGP